MTHLELNRTEHAELLIGLRLRREQLRKQAADLPQGTAKGILWAKVDICTTVIARMEALQ